MLWRMAGRTRSLFGFSRRRMSGKRLVIGVACTVCLTLGVYLKFFNHESADELLQANRQELLAEPIVAKPNFHRLKAYKETDIASDGDKKDAKALENHLKVRTQVESDIGKGDVAANIGDDLQEEEKGNENGDEAAEHPKLMEVAVNVVAPDGNQALSGDNHEQNVPIVEGDKEDEDDEELRNAGGDGGEHNEEEEEVEDGGRGGGDGVRPNGRGPHGIKMFDWDKWVKENDFVELGNIWAYCDDANPPVVGKVLLLPDEEEGGLKNVLIFNTTLEYDVVMGKAEVSIDYNDMHFFSNVFDFADLENEGDFFKCPVAKGDQYFVREQHLSALIPKGHYYGEARLTDQNDKVILCSQMNLQMN